MQVHAYLSRDVRQHETMQMQTMTPNVDSCTVKLSVTSKAVVWNLGCYIIRCSHGGTAGVQATVIGGGYIGMETAAGLNKNGLDVTLVFPEKHLMERLFTPEVAQFYEKYYTDKGITLKSGSLATEFEGKDGVVRILCLPCKRRDCIPLMHLGAEE